MGKGDGLAAVLEPRVEERRAARLLEEFRDGRLFALVLGELAVSGLDLFVAGGARNAKGRIRIGHGVLARCNSAGAQAARLSYIGGAR